MNHHQDYDGWYLWSLINDGCLKVQNTKTLQIFLRFLYFVLLNNHRWFNITNVIPHCPDDGSLESKRYSVDFASQ